MTPHKILAKDLMTVKPVVCEPATTLVDAARKMANADCGALPVVDFEDGGQPLGVVTDRDIVCRALAVGRDPMTMVVRDCMSGPAVTVGADSTLDECCESMEANQIRRLVVVNGDGQVIGMVSQADVAKAASEAKTAEVLREVSLRNDQLGATF